jgi:hypothetical protein
VVWVARAEAVVAGEDDELALARAEPARSYGVASLRRFGEIRGSSWGRPSIPPREQRHVDGSVIGEEDPSLEHDTAGTGHFESITVRCERARVGAKFTVRAVKRHELPQLREQRRLVHHSIT